jgi:hypothetical protein
MTEGKLKISGLNDIKVMKLVAGDMVCCRSDTHDPSIRRTCAEESGVIEPVKER